MGKTVIQKYQWKFGSHQYQVGYETKNMSMVHYYLFKTHELFPNDLAISLAKLQPLFVAERYCKISYLVRATPPFSLSRNVPLKSPNMECLNKYCVVFVLSTGVFNQIWYCVVNCTLNYILCQLILNRRAK